MIYIMDTGNRPSESAATGKLNSPIKRFKELVFPERQKTASSLFNSPEKIQEALSNPEVARILHCRLNGIEPPFQIGTKGFSKFLEATKTLRDLGFPEPKD